MTMTMTSLRKVIKTGRRKQEIENMLVATIMV